MKLTCSAVIPNEQERKAIMSWVRAGKFQSYSEIEQTVHVTYVSDETDPDESGRFWGIIHVFEQYAEHTINYDKGKGVVVCESMGTAQ